MVVFERLYYESREIAFHADLEDEGQTVTYRDVKLGTSAAEKGTGKKEITTSKKTTIIDVVKYEGLIPGKQYTVKGTLMDKATKKALLVDGKKVTAEKSFTPKEASGSVELSFTFDSSALQGKAVVAFESLYYEGREIAAHEDLEDQDQTVRFVEEEETETKETTAPNKNVTSTGGTTVTPPKTGDHTRVILYVLLAAGRTCSSGYDPGEKEEKVTQPTISEARMCRFRHSLAFLMQRRRHVKDGKPKQPIEEPDHCPWFRGRNHRGRPNPEPSAGKRRRIFRAHLFWDHFNHRLRHWGAGRKDHEVAASQYAVRVQEGEI